LPVIARIEDRLKEIDRFAKLHKVSVLRDVGIGLNYVQLK